MKQKIRRHLLSLGTTAALLLAAPAVIASSSAYEEGLAAARDHRYSEAVRHFSVAAAQGDKDAQRNLGLMLLYGERLYGREVPRDRERGLQWLRTAAAQGCQVSTYMYKKLTRHAG